MIEVELIDIIDVANTLGEGVVWRASDQTVWWTDIQERRMFRLTWPAGSVQSFGLAERLGSFGLVEGDDRRFVCAFESGFALFEPETGKIDWLARPPELEAHNVRLNDGKVGPDGSFWAGSMHEGDGETPCETGFYRLAGASGARLEIPGLGIPNGLAWSPSGNAMYYADTVEGVIRRRDEKGGSSVFAKPQAGAPDGATVDSEGRYWSALWGGGRLAVYSPDGDALSAVELPAPQPTCPAFGGPDMNLIFVTSAREGLDGQSLSAFPKSGGLFVLRTNARGLPGYRYRL